MGPLVPEILSNEFNLIVALFVGIGFGWILEQAGFSTTKKLVGLFYGYDFTVLKVFFTAGITAMIGVLFLDHIDLLNIELIYVNPTFLWSALVGGAIMGVGFIIGGFCPGTSVCAAATGKIDAIAFVVGSIIGIVVFFEAYPLFEELYKSEAWGAVKANDFLGISNELFAAIFIFIAVGSFWGVTLIENKINNRTTKYPKQKVTIRTAIVAISVAVILFVAFTPEREIIIHEKIEETIKNNTIIYAEYSADKLATELLSKNYAINLIDVRSPEKFKEFHIPLAVNIPYDSLMNIEWKEYFTQKYKKNIFYSDDKGVTKRAYLLSGYLGESDKYILIENSKEFKEQFVSANKTSEVLAKKEYEKFLFRQKTGQKLIELEQKFSKFSQPVKKKVSKIQGGCS